MTYNYLFTILLFTCFFSEEKIAQDSSQNICDTIWIFKGEEYSYNPLKNNLLDQIKFTENSNFRGLVDSLSKDTNAIYDREELAKKILEEDSIFKENWSSSLFPSLNPISSKDTINFSIIEGNETYFFNFWGTFNWGFGPRWGRMHRGLDLELKMRDTVRSTFNGIVRYAGFNSGGYGNCVIIRHFNGIETLYGHLDKLLVKPGQLVIASEIIGLGGTTGRSNGPHLHFETRYKGKAFDPLKIFNKGSYDIRSNYLMLVKKDITDPYIPSKTKKYHTVKSGETLSHIAKKHKTTVSKIQKLNKLKNPNLINVGQRIRVR